MKQLFGYIDIFPQHEVHSGKPCLIIGNFEKCANFSALNGKIVDAVITGLSTTCRVERRGMILNFGTWVHGQPNVYGMTMVDSELSKGTVVSIEISIPDLGGV